MPARASTAQFQSGTEVPQSLFAAGQQCPLMGREGESNGVLIAGLRVSWFSRFRLSVLFPDCLEV